MLEIMLYALALAQLRALSRRLTILSTASIMLFLDLFGVALLLAFMVQIGTASALVCDGMKGPACWPKAQQKSTGRRRSRT